MKNLDFLLTGVGGQGIILASDILAEVGMAAGYDVKKSDILGLAVRGGSVLSQVRWGEKVASPVVLPGGVDFLLGFEPLEAVRYLMYLSPKSTVIVNTHPILPVSVSSGNASYPSLDEIKRMLKEVSRQAFFIDATEIAVKLGTPRVTNVILLGAVATQMNVPVETWEDVIISRVPSKHRDLNLQAFYTGLRVLKEV